MTIFLLKKNLKIQVEDFLFEKRLYFGMTHLASVPGDKNCITKEKKSIFFNFKKCVMPNKLRSTDTNLNGAT